MYRAIDNSYRTAIVRRKLSAPTKYLVENNLLNPYSTLDYGCGRGFDCDEMGYDGYDPYYRPEYPIKKYKTIMCNFVLNVLPEYQWEKVLTYIENLLDDDGVAYISVRNDKSNLNGFTKIGTYQTFVKLNLPVEKKTSTFVMYKLEKQNG